MRFQGVNKLFILSFKNDGQRISKKRFLPCVEIKDYKVMIDERNFFDQPNNKQLLLEQLILVKEMITQLVVC